MGAINGDGNRLPAEQMGLPTAQWYSTSLPGSTGIMASETAGGEVGSPVVSLPLASSQVPANMPRLPVAAGDTSGMSDDLAVHQSALIPSHTSDTGIGHGHAGHEA
jgi:hypothetical protein